MAQLHKKKGPAPFGKKAMRLLELSKRSAKRMLMSERMRMGMDNALIEAAKNGKNDKIKRLIKAGASITAKDKNGLAALYNAVRYGHTETCALLIEKNKEANGNVKRLIAVKGITGDTVLHRAADNGYTDICKLLIQEYAKAGGDIRKIINAKNDAGRTALHLAATNIDTRTCALLMENGADVTARDNFDNTPLDIAILNRRILPMRFLAPKLLEAIVGSEAFSQFMNFFGDCLAI